MASDGNTPRSWSQAFDVLTRVLAPVGLITAVVYYFGYVREQALFGYFGVDLGTVGFGTSDYLVRSAGTLFIPLAVILMAAILAVGAHVVIVRVLERGPAGVRRRTWAAIAVVAVALLVTAVVGFARRAHPFIGPLAAPVMLGTGALLLEYVLLRAQEDGSIGTSWTSALGATDLTRRVLTATLVLVAGFWATANAAEQRGLAAARAFEVSLVTQPQAVVYSRTRLQISGPGVGVEQLSTDRTAFDYRYNGLRTLLHSHGRWFLLPAGWTHDNGSTAVLLPDDQTDIRVDLAP